MWYQLLPVSICIISSILTDSCEKDNARMAKPAPANTNSDISSGKDRHRFTMEKLTELKEDGRTLIYYKFLPADAHANTDVNATGEVEGHR